MLTTTKSNVKLSLPTMLLKHLLKLNKAVSVQLPKLKFKMQKNKSG
jgi:hypothetical protein